MKGTCEQEEESLEELWIVRKVGVVVVWFCFIFFFNSCREIDWRKIRS